MTYTHLTTSELVMIEAYVDNRISVLKIAQSLKRSRQTINKDVTFLNFERSANDYYKLYRANKYRCILSDDEKTFIQGDLKQDWSLDVIKGTFPERISYTMRTLYRLVDRGGFKREEMPWKSKRKPNDHSEKRGERAEKYPDFKIEFGHLEGNTIVGKNHKSTLITLVERLSRAIILLQTNGRKAGDIEIAIHHWMANFRNMFSSPLPLIAVRSFQTGNLCPRNMTLTFSLRILVVQVSLVSMNIRMGS